MQDITIETVVDYAIDFMRIIGTPQMFEEKVELIPVENYRAQLPCDYYQMKQIRLFDFEGNVVGTFRYTTDTFHLSEFKPDYSDLTYKIQGSIIYTSIQAGVIEVVYQAISTDEVGYPLIPNNSSFTRALEAYIKKQHFTILFDMSKISQQSFTQALQDYAWAVGDAQTEFNRMSLDKAESFYNSWRTLIIRPSEHRSGFLHDGTQEKLKLKN